MAAIKVLCNKIRQMKECQVQPQVGDSTMATIGVLWKRMSQMEKHMCHSTCSLPKLPPTSSQGPRCGRVQRAHPTIQYCQCLKTKQDVCLRTGGGGGLPASLKTPAGPSPSSIMLTHHSGSGTAQPAAQEAGNTHPSGPGW